ncbi:delta endotoxin C-terminal domain-containing protein [Bacillus cereus]|uniref:delta endotoxin C-terminal domain-containing protein n=1 Tax=Bacillus TaxID=1386 RepID=UPI000BF450AD|nr:hypothetical protein COK74_25585 [Bacillus cereus]
MHYSSNTNYRFLIIVSGRYALSSKIKKTRSKNDAFNLGVIKTTFTFLNKFNFISIDVNNFKSEGEIYIAKVNFIPTK